MCSRPVTFGGGMTITNRGEPSGPVGWKRPSSSQRRYHRSSNCAGSNVFSSFLPESSSPATGEGIAGTVSSCMKEGRKGPFSLSETGRNRQAAGGSADAPLLDAALELSDALPDDELRHLGNDFPRDFLHDPVGKALDDLVRDPLGEPLDLGVAQLPVRLPLPARGEGLGRG